VQEEQDQASNLRQRQQASFQNACGVHETEWVQIYWGSGKNIWVPWIILTICSDIFRIDQRTDIQPDLMIVYLRRPNLRIVSKMHNLIWKGGRRMQERSDLCPCGIMRFNKLETLDQSRKFRSSLIANRWSWEQSLTQKEAEHLTICKEVILSVDFL